MIFKRRVEREVEVDGVVFVVKTMTATEQADYYDTFLDKKEEGKDEKKSGKPTTHSLLRLAQQLFDTVIKDVKGLVDEDGEPVEYPKDPKTGIVDPGFIEGFEMGELQKIVEAVQGVGKVSEKTKKNS